jgi:hypothetical protein
MCVRPHGGCSFWQDGTSWFSFQAWMVNPYLLPRAKTITFFDERASRSGVSDGPLPLPPPPKGTEVPLLIHLDYYYDRTPQAPSLTDSASSDVSGLPSSSSGSSDMPFPFYRSFSWLPGAIDGHSEAQIGGHNFLIHVDDKGSDRGPRRRRPGCGAGLASQHQRAGLPSR